MRIFLPPLAGGGTGAGGAGGGGGVPGGGGGGGGAPAGFLLLRRRFLEPLTKLLRLRPTFFKKSILLFTKIISGVRNSPPMLYQTHPVSTLLPLPLPQPVFRGNEMPLRGQRVLWVDRRP